MDTGMGRRRGMPTLPGIRALPAQSPIAVGRPIHRAQFRLPTPERSSRWRSDSLGNVGHEGNCARRRNATRRFKVRRRASRTCLTPRPPRLTIVSESVAPPSGYEAPFAESERSTVGIEWELALVDVDTGDMRQAAPAIMAELDQSGDHPHIQQEFMQNAVELVSGVCHTIKGAGQDIYQTSHQLRAISDPMRVGLISSGTHPFATWQTQKITEAKRYRTVIDRAASLGQQIAIFGVHTHVGVESREKVLPIINSMLSYQPYLQALSASSPYFNGADTGYASIRAILFQQLPTAGLPYQFTTWDQWSAYVDDLLSTGVINSLGELHWDIRPAGRYGTIEVRVCDGTSNVAELLAMSALTHCLVESLSEKLDRGEEMPTLPAWFVAENKWRAARYGLDARIVVDQAGTQAPLRELVPQLVAQLRPTARLLECEPELLGVLDILGIGAGYERQRQVYHRSRQAGASDHEALEAIVAHLVAEMRADHPINPLSC